MSSTLGRLPEFGTGRGGLSSSSSRPTKDSGFDDFGDDDLDFLLGDNSDKKATQKSKAGRGGERSSARPKANGPRSSRKPLKTDSDNFYGQMAALANDDVESEEDIEPLTEADSKKIADSVNLDDMDANLFGSFSRSLNQKRRRSSLKESTDTKTSNNGGASQKESTSALFGGAGKDEETKSISLTPVEKKAVTKPLVPDTSQPKSKKAFDFDDDDLLDLLSDSGDEEQPPRKREKPKIQLTSKPKSPPSAVPTTAPPTTLADKSSQDDGKPITSTGISDRGEGGGRPKTSRGKEEEGNSSSNPPPLSGVQDSAIGKGSLSSRADVLKVDNPATPRQETPGDLFASGEVDFGDDLLSGMGLDDSDLEKPVEKRSGGRGSSVVGDLFGTNAASSSKVLESKSTKKNEDKHSSDGGEGEGFQFGGYMPSAATAESAESTPSVKPRLKLPSGRRGSSELSDSLTSRPGSAPAPVKKSVRFSNTVETNDRPSSSPATSETTTPSSRPLGSRRGVSTSLPEEDGLSNAIIDDKAKKPPLPRRNAPTVKSSETAVGGAREESGDKIEDVVQNQSDGVGADVNGESTTEKAPVRGRGRKTSLTKPATNALFDGTGDTMADPTLGVGGGEDSKLKTASAGQSDQEERLERPLFLWQKGRQKRSQSLGSGVGAAGSAGAHLPVKGPGTSSGNHMTMAHDSTVDHTSQIASFQEILLQQQKQMQEQFALTLQSQLGGGATTEVGGATKEARSSDHSAEEEERLRGEVKSLHSRVKELEDQVQVEKSRHSEVQNQVDELQIKLEAAEGERKKAEVEAKEHREKMSELENGHQKTHLEQTNQLEELKMKLHRTELERTQLQYSVESMKSRHTEEVDSIQKAHDTRMKAVEESFQRRETRWREEAESEATRHQDKLQQLEREKVDAVLALKKKIDALEVSKTNEINRLQDIHRNSIEDLKREHEQDKHHLINMHRQEMEAIKAAHSHTRMLSELSHQVETSSREVSQLQAKLERANTARAEEQGQRAKIHQEQLKTLEDRLMKQQAENSAERERLQLLIAKLESHIAQQSKTIEQEKWHLQQDSARLKSQQSAFEEERASFLRKMAEDRDQLQVAREKFLVEQRDVLAKCYEERRSLAAERAELDVMKKAAHEREQRHKESSIQIEADLEASRNHLREESARVSSESTQLRQDQLKLKTESEVVAREKERLDALAKDIEHRSHEAKKLHQSGLSMKEKGEKSLSEAQKLRDQLQSRSMTIEQQLVELKKKEKQVATEQLYLARQKRELNIFDLQLSTRDSPDNDDDGHNSPDNLAAPSQLYQPVPTSEPVSVATATQNLVTTLPPLSLHQASCSSFESLPLLSSSAPLQSTTIPPPPLPSRYQNGHHAPPQTSFQLSQHLQPSHTSSLQQHSSHHFGDSGRRYSPASSPTHSFLPPVTMGIHGSGRSFKSELARIEHTRNMRQLALLAEQDYQALEEENKFLTSLQSGRGHYSIKT